MNAPLCVYDEEGRLVSMVQTLPEQRSIVTWYYYPLGTDSPVA